MLGKLIVLDGADGCGKATQTKKLLGRLRSGNQAAETLDFPQYYNNQFGNIVGCFLRGDFGDPAQISPYLSSILYAADRFESSKLIWKWLDEGKIVVLDRYVSANQIHQGGKIKNENSHKVFLSWLDKIEHGIFGIPRPDLIIYLDVSANIAQKLIEQKSDRAYIGKTKDKVEENMEYQLNSREQSLRLISQMNNWKRIVCEEGGQLLSVDAIHEKIWAVLRESGIINAMPIY